MCVFKLISTTLPRCTLTGTMLTRRHASRRSVELPFPGRIPYKASEGGEHSGGIGGRFTVVTPGNVPALLCSSAANEGI